MSFLFSWMYDVLAYFGLYYKDAKVLFLGLDGAGKTTLLRLLKTGKVGAFDPTIYAGKEELVHGSLKIEAHDLGGHVGVRRVWKDYFHEVDGVVFIVDAADRGRFPEARGVLEELLSNERMAAVPFLILGNKIDRPEACPEGELRTALNIIETTGKDASATLSSGVRPLELFMCSLTSRMGYDKGIEWLSTFLKNA